MSEPAPQQYDPREAAQPASQWPTPSMGASVTTMSAPDDATIVRSPATRPPRRRSFVGDVSAGLLLGDFARDLGLPGAVTQVAISFVPLIGSMCAVRDLTADLRHHDGLGAFLNVLALTPIFGGFSKTFEVMRSTAHVGHAVHSAHRQAERRKHVAS
jgi:hypothetical protein